MDHPPLPQLERYMDWLRVQARQFHLDARFQPRFGHSDLVQKTMVRARKNLDQLRDHSDERVMRWLQEILHNVFIEQIRHETAQKRDVRLEKKLQDAVGESSARLERIFEAKESSPSERAERKERELRLAAALERLPANERDVIILFHYQEKSIAEIAEQLERTEKSVQGVLDRGRKRLRKMLENEGF